MATDAPPTTRREPSVPRSSRTSASPRQSRSLRGSRENTDSSAREDIEKGKRRKSRRKRKRKHSPSPPAKSKPSVTVFDFNSNSGECEQITRVWGDIETARGKIDEKSATTPDIRIFVVELEEAFSPDAIPALFKWPYLALDAMIGATRHRRQGRDKPGYVDITRNFITSLSEWNRHTDPAFGTLERVLGLVTSSPEGLRSSGRWSVLDLHELFCRDSIIESVREATIPRREVVKNMESRAEGNQSGIEGGFPVEGNATERPTENEGASRTVEMGRQQQSDPQAQVEAEPRSPQRLSPDASRQDVPPRASGFLLQSNVFDTALPSIAEHPNFEARFSLIQPKPKKWNSGRWGLGISFWETNCATEVVWIEKDQIEIFCYFPALKLTWHPLEPEPDYVSPAQKQFENLLLSKRSSLRLLGSLQRSHRKDQERIELAAKLVILDLLRSSGQLWDVFLRGLNSSVVTPSPDIPLERYEEDLAIATDIAATVREANSCLSYLVESISESLSSDEKETRSWRLLSLELRTMTGSLKTSTEHLRELVRHRFDIVVANFNETQANSALRLSVVASIFLPMTLAATLLAMTETVTSLGEKWFHWVGLWLTIGAVVLLVVFVWKKLDKIHVSVGPIIGGVIHSVSASFLSFIYLWLPLALCVLLATFWAGMLAGLPEASHTLKLGVAAFFALLGLRIFIFILWPLLRYGARTTWHAFRAILKKEFVGEIKGWLLFCEFWLSLYRQGGTLDDMANVATAFGLPQDLTSLGILVPQSRPSQSRLDEALGRVLRAAAGSRMLKKQLRRKEEDIRAFVQGLERSGDEGVRETLQKVRLHMVDDRNIKDLLERILSDPPPQEPAREDATAAGPQATATAATVEANLATA